MNSCAVQTELIKKSYGSIPVLKGIIRNINVGEKFAVIGASACGKNTLLQCVISLESIMQAKSQLME